MEDKKKIRILREKLKTHFHCWELNFQLDDKWLLVFDFGRDVYKK